MQQRGDVQTPAWKHWAIRIWKVLNPILIGHGLYSLLKDSALFGSWAHDIIVRLGIPTIIVQAVRSAADAAVDTYRMLVWPALSWLDIALRDFVFVLLMIYGPTFVVGLLAIWRSARGGSGNAVFRSAANRQFYIQSVVSIIVGIRALDEPSAYFYVTACLCFLTPLQFIRHLDYRRREYYGFEKSRDTLIWYFMIVGVPFAIAYPAFKLAPEVPATLLTAGSIAMLGTSLLLSALNFVQKRRSR